MKLVALEEHFATPGIMAAWQALPPERRDLAVGLSSSPEIAPRLYDLADGRVAAMDAMGVDVQVLSLTTPGVEVLAGGQDALATARQCNDLIAATVRARPDRFQGFATLPMGDPPQAADELERAVRELGLNGAMLHGAVSDKNLDHPDFQPVFARAAALRAPLYFHPNSPRPPVRRTYYEGFNEKLSTAFATAGIGWHYEDGMQALRLVLAGVFDRFPDLQIILGHWGEVVLFYLDRVDLMNKLAGLERPISSYFRSNMFVTGSGLLSPRYLRWSREVIGIERLMFSVDYPFVTPKPDECRRFLGDSGLTEAEQAQIASGNWERLCAGIRR